jgi:phosphatidylserine/phosphatidylglycerophosphate/cardiolipin synthase-like enzyme
MKLLTKGKIILVLLLTLMVLNWGTISDLLKNWDNVTGRSVEELPEVLEETTVAPEVYFCPADDCIGEMIAWLDAAEEYIHCAIFEVELEELQEKLDSMSSEVEVKVITDDRYYDEVEHLDFVKHDNRKSGLMHNKFCVLDGKAVWTGSFNPTKRGNYHNNNNVVFYQSQLLAANYEAEFQEMWNGVFGKGDRTEHPEMTINGNKIESYFCPEDWCSNKVIYALQEAEESIYFMTFSFTHDEVGEQVLERAAAGVDVRGVFEKSQNNEYLEYYKFIDAGLNVRWDGNGANMHHKVFIIDSEIVVTGSFNPSNNADKRNDENVLIIHDAEVAALFVEEFEKVWGEAEEE